MLTAAAGLVLASASGCAGVGLNFLSPYRFEIQQGNFVSSEMVSQLRDGMTRDQVKFTLGTPMLTSAFRDDRWDYVFYIRRSSGVILERKLTVWFESNKLARWEGDKMPSERAAPDTDVPVEPPVVPPAPATPPTT